MRLPCLSLWQPWASAIGRGKSIETRHWEAPDKLIRQRFAIHAAKRPLTKAEKCLVDTLRLYHGLDLSDVPYGALVCTAILEECFEIPERPSCFFLDPFDPNDTGIMLPSTDPIEKLLGNYSPGRYAWVFGDVRFLPVPIPAVGRQGIWFQDVETTI